MFGSAVRLAIAVRKPVGGVGRNRVGDHRDQLLNRGIQIVRKIVEPRNQIAFDQVEALADDLRLLMRRVIDIQIGEMKFELEAGRDVRDAERLDDTAPLDSADALRAHRDAEPEAVGGFEFYRCYAARGRARELGILGVEKLAIVEAVPKLGAAAGRGVEFALERLAQRDVVDGHRNADL